MADFLFKLRLKMVYRLLGKMYPFDVGRDDFHLIEFSRSINARMFGEGRILSVIQINPEGDGYRVHVFDSTQIEVADG